MGKKGGHKPISGQLLKSGKDEESPRASRRSKILNISSGELRMDPSGKRRGVRTGESSTQIWCPLSQCLLPGVVLDAGAAAVEETEINPCPQRADLAVGKT